MDCLCRGSSWRSLLTGAAWGFAFQSIPHESVFTEQRLETYTLVTNNVSNVQL
jgi:hypothetical protein